MSILTIPPEIDATGATDVSGPLSEFLAAVPDNSTVTFPIKATYWHERPIVFQGRSGLTIEGNGTTVLQKTDGSSLGLRGNALRGRKIFQVEDCSGFFIRKMNARGAHPSAGQADGSYFVDLEGQHAYDFKNCRDVIVRDCNASDVYGDLLYIGGSLAGSVNNRVIGGRYERSGRQGMAVTGGTNHRLRGVFLSRAARTTLDVEPTNHGEGVNGLLVKECTFDAGNSMWFHSGGGGYRTNIVVRENVVAMNMSALVHPSPGSPYHRCGSHHFIANRNTVLTGGPQPYFRFHHTDGVKVIGNVGKHQARGSHAIRTCNSTSIEIRDNDLLTGCVGEWENFNLCGDDHDAFGPFPV